MLQYPYRSTPKPPALEGLAGSCAHRRVRAVLGETACFLELFHVGPHLQSVKEVGGGGLGGVGGGGIIEARSTAYTIRCFVLLVSQCSTRPKNKKCFHYGVEFVPLLVQKGFAVAIYRWLDSSKADQQQQ